MLEKTVYVLVGLAAIYVAMIIPKLNKA
jgi:uncharacterized membrane protein YuzA (DUF378 family)